MDTFVGGGADAQLSVLLVVVLIIRVIIGEFIISTFWLIDFVPDPLIGFHFIHVGSWINLIHNLILQFSELLCLPILHEQGSFTFACPLIFLPFWLSDVI